MSLPELGYQLITAVGALTVTLVRPGDPLSIVTEPGATGDPTAS